MSPSLSSAVQSLESSLQLVLPANMIPSLYLPVCEMPLTASGKLNRKTLVTLAQAMSDEAAAAYRLGSMGGRTPSTEMQELWSVVLSKPANTIGVDDSFFRHGGDSIGAMKLVNVARSKGITLTVASIFQRPKLSEMAADASNSSSESRKEITNTSGKTEPFSLLPKTTDIDDLLDEIASVCDIDPEIIQDVYPCTSLQGGLIALSSRSPGAYVLQATFKLPSGINLVRFRSAWEAVSAAEAVLRTRIVYAEELGFLQAVVNQPVDWETFETLRDIPDESRKLRAQDGGVLCRYAIVGEGTPDLFFVWTAHHAIYDGWSLSTLYEKVAGYYRDPRPEALPAAVSFRDFIGYLSSIDVEESNRFWISQLENATSISFPQVPDRAYKSKPTETLTRNVPIPRVPDRETTLPSIIRAAWALVVSSWSGCTDVVFGEIMTGRDAPVPGIEDLIGPTLSTVPTRVKVDPDLSIAEYLRTVQIGMAKALPYQFAGLQNIKGLSPGAAAACGFQNCIAITQESDESAGGLFDMVAHNTTGANFYTYPLTLDCALSDSNVKIGGHYDPNVISSSKLESVFLHLETVIGRLASGALSEEKVGDIVPPLAQEPLQDPRRGEQKVEIGDQHQLRTTTSRQKPSRRLRKAVDIDANLNIGEEMRKIWSHVLKMPLEEIELTSSFLYLVSIQSSCDYFYGSLLNVYHQTGWRFHICHGSHRKSPIIGHPLNSTGHYGERINCRTRLQSSRPEAPGLGGG
jgi:aryl carrier-like protein